MLTAEQIQHFTDNGYLIIRGLFSGNEIDEMRAAADELQRDAIEKLRAPNAAEQMRRLNKDWIEHPETHYVYREKPDGTLSFHRVERMFTRQPVFARFAMDPRLLEAAGELIGRPFWPRAGALVIKLPHEGAEVRWHQDIPYLYFSSGDHPSKGRSETHPIPNFTTDIYLDPSNEENGCLYAIPGSHRNGSVDVDKLVAEHGFMLPDAVPLEIEPGDLMFHHTALVHGSPENRSPQRRRTFYIHYMSDVTLNDAYSDWPDIMPDEEAIRFWSAAAPPDARQQYEFKPGGIRPRAPRQTPAVA